MMSNRIIALIDMDCFYCQVEVRLNPSLKDKPLAVVQYNTWKGGGIIAVNYEARDRGVTRHMRGDEAKGHCPEIELVHVPSVRGKADLTKEAGREVAAVLCENCKCVERASIDEAYLDLTEEVNERFAKEENVPLSSLVNTFIVGYSQQGSNDEWERSEGLTRWLHEIQNEELDDIDSKKLAIGACIVEEIRASVYEKTGFQCSAGIAHNKIMAKLVCGLHKPNRQTVLPSSGVAELFSTLPVQKVRNLGGKFGLSVIDTLGCKVMEDLTKFSERELQSHFDEKTGTWLYNIARGVDLEPVTSKLMSKSIGCCKRFPGRNALRTRNDVMHWLEELSSEISDRLDEDYNLHKRRAHLLTASVQQVIDKKKVAMSKSCHISAYDTESIITAALAAIKKTNNAPSNSDLWQPPLQFLGISVGKFAEESSSSSKTISHFFKSTPVDKCLQSNKAATRVDSHSITKDEKQSSSTFCQETASKSSGIGTKCSSFFEKYMRNKKIKSEAEVIQNEEDSVNVTLPHENEEALNHGSENENNFSLVGEFNVESIDAVTLDSVRTEIASDDRVDSTKKETERSIDNLVMDNDNKNLKNGEDINWISPSEIFPDINDIDKSLIDIMPSPIREKLTSSKGINKSDKDGIQNKTQITDISSNKLEVKPSTSSYNCYTHTNSNNLKHTTEEESQFKLSSEIDISPDVFVDDECEISSDLSVSHAAINHVDRSEITDYEYEISEVCPHCGETVRLSQFPEHLDHHVALDLHKTLNKNGTSPVSKKRIINSSDNKPLKKKRGRPNKDQISEKQRNSKSILSFFSRK